MFGRKVVVQDHRDKPPWHGEIISHKATYVSDEGYDGWYVVVEDADGGAQPVALYYLTLKKEG